MRKAALLATAFLFAGANLALALPAAPVGAAGQGFSAGSEGPLTLVSSQKKSAKKSESKKKNAKKSGGGSGGGMNMQGMPPGHRM